jgi:predicted nucleic acid-binding protein
MAELPQPLMEGFVVRVLLDTNIIIHREASRIMRSEIGVLFKWIDNLHYSKCVHPVTVEEINKYKDDEVRRTFNVKLDSYNILQTVAPFSEFVEEVSRREDKNQNDLNDTKLLNEVFAGRVDILITEDRKILHKARLLGIADKVYTIDSFLERVTAEHPELVDYSVLAVKKELFGNIDLADEFFDSLKQDYPDFERWFNRKAEETAYVCKVDDKIAAFLYLKVEDENENYSDIYPTFTRKRRLKIGTFKVSLNGNKLGERFIKIIFDNAVRFKVDEIYVTIFNKRIEQERLIRLLEDFGFVHHGYKRNGTEEELVYVRSMEKPASLDRPKCVYPYIPTRGNNIYFVSIYPEYHTDLFPDSILRTESPNDFIENEPFRNAISKVYISRAPERNLQTGDVLVFYRTGGIYKGVVTTIGIVENVITNIRSEEEFISLCRKRSVFSDDELREHWNYNPRNRPFIVNFLYTYSLPKRPNLAKLVEIGVFPNIFSLPRGFGRLSREQFMAIMREAHANESLIID